MITPEKLAAYLEGTLDDAARAEVEEQLKGDNDALCFVIAQRRTDRALRSLLTAPERRERLAQSIAAAVHAEPREQLRAEVLADTVERRRTGVVHAIQNWLAGLWQPAMRWRLGTAVTLVLTVGLAIIIGWRNQGGRQGAFLAGQLRGVVVEREGQSLTAASEMNLKGDDLILAGEESRVKIQFSQEKTTIQLAPETAIKVRSIEGQKRFDLLSGSVKAEIAPQKAGAMIWVTDNAEARVLGTAFALSSDGLITRLDVTKGAVELGRRDGPQATVVQAGQFATADARNFSGPRPLAGADSPAHWNVPTGTPPGLVHTVFRSESLGFDIGANVLLPPRYGDFPDRKFPVLYVLPDSEGNENIEAARFGPVFRAAMARRELLPFIAVFPNTGPGHVPASQVVGQMLARELPAHVDATYRTIPFRGMRAVCGVGHGGHRAVLLTMLHGQAFGAGAALDDPVGSGPPAFRFLLERRQALTRRFGTPILLLNSTDRSVAKTDTLAEFLGSLGATTEMRALPVPTPEHPAYPAEAWNQLRPWLQKHWLPPRGR